MHNIHNCWNGEHHKYNEDGLFTLRISCLQFNLVYRNGPKERWVPIERRVPIERLGVTYQSNNNRRVSNERLAQIKRLCGK